MLLAIDIGNSQVHLGIFQGKKLVRDWTLPSQPAWSTQKYLSLVKPVIARSSSSSVIAKSAKRDEAISPINHCIIASVVPVLTRIFQKVGMQLAHEMPLVVNVRNCGGLKIKVDHSREVGADRLVNCVAAYELYGTPAIVIDFGTAITFDLVSAKKEYLGGVIAPGLGTAAEALHRRTALLPEIRLARPRRVCGKNTVTCMQSGIYYSAVGLIESLLPRLQKELRWRHPKIILTGGQASLISPAIGLPHHLSPKLTLQGLRIIVEKLDRL